MRTYLMSKELVYTGKHILIQFKNLTVTINNGVIEVEFNSVKEDNKQVIEISQLNPQLVDRELLISSYLSRING